MCSQHVLGNPNAYLRQQVLHGTRRHPEEPKWSSQQVVKNPLVGSQK